MVDMQIAHSKALRKVPEVTAIFWAVKLLTTAMGEATSDWLVTRINPFLAVGVGALCFAIAISIQLRARKYSPLIYWFAASMVAVFGTMAADGLHVQLGVPYILSSALFAVALTAVFITWRKVEGSLSIHTVTSGRREVFYWLTVIATFALGTALGDLSASTFGLGLPIRAPIHRHHTHPCAWLLVLRLGRSCRLLGCIRHYPADWRVFDWMSKPQAISGLNWGDGRTALILLAGLVCVVAVNHARTKANSS